jgi:hypothetical protein
MNGNTAQKPSLNKRRPSALVIGYALLGLHVLTWFPGVFLIPLIPIPIGKRALIAGVLITIGEAAFWASLPFLGKEFVTRFRRRLNPLNWFRRKPASGEVDRARDEESRI